MPAAPKPENEAERLDALWSYDLLDTKQEPAFDAISALAADICDIPIALVSLVDANRQWFKASCGLPGVSSTPRDLAFCAHAILQSDILVVPDATKDARFADNPLVTGELGIRFYAGVPLITADGMPLGTLCVIDQRPKTLDKQQLGRLRLLGDTLVGLIEARVRRSRSDARQLGLLDAALAQAQHRATQLHGLVDFAKLAVAASSGDEVLSFALETALRVCAADDGFVVIRTDGVWRVCRVHGALAITRGEEVTSVSRSDPALHDLEIKTGMSATIATVGDDEPIASLVIFKPPGAITSTDSALLELIALQSRWAWEAAVNKADSRVCPTWA